jgi:hypothetical protein
MQCLPIKKLRAPSLELSYGPLKFEAMHLQCFTPGVRYLEIRSKSL